MDELNMIQRKIFRFGVLAMIFLMPLWGFGQKGEKIQTIVIDAGHGGRDPGARGNFATEKSINLGVALKLGAYIEENLPDVKVIYTRTTDKFLELSERADIANSNNADVFISIHCNSVDGINTAQGVETYVMGESKNEANLSVAMKENAAILLESNTKAYDNFDPNSPEAYIIFSLSQSLYQSQSLKLAGKVQKQLTQKVGRKDRGVQQAGFLVLWKTTMPSILVELGFISNMKEEQFLKSEKGQSQLALAIYRAFEEYKLEFETENRMLASKSTSSKTESAKTENSKPVSTKTESTKTENSKPASNKTENTKKESNKPVDNKTESSKTESNKPIENKTESSKPNDSGETTPVATGDTYFAVQFSTLNKKLSVTDPAFKGIKDVTVYEHKGAYRYISGHFLTKSEAITRQSEVRRLGFTDAFVVAFVNGKRATVKEAEEALGKK
jgi:N-acetylmuramoyl-L-alanine amidase